jgi:hypothetical protein
MDRHRTRRFGAYTLGLIVLSGVIFAGMYVVRGGKRPHTALAGSVLCMSAAALILYKNDAMIDDFQKVSRKTIIQEVAIALALFTIKTTVVCIIFFQIL